MIGWTVLCLPTVMIATFCLSLKARCFLAFAFVARMAINSPQNSSHGGTVVSKRNRTNISLTKTRTTQISRLKNGIGLTMKLGEHDCCAIVVTGGLIVWAHISEVTITRAVISKKKMNIISNNLAVLLSCKSLSVKRGSLFWWSPSPSTVLAKRMMTPAYKVFSTKIPWNTNFNWNQPKPIETDWYQLKKIGNNRNQLKPIETNWNQLKPIEHLEHQLKLLLMVHLLELRGLCKRKIDCVFFLHLKNTFRVYDDSEETNCVAQKFCEGQTNPVLTKDADCWYWQKGN